MVLVTGCCADDLINKRHVAVLRTMYMCILQVYDNIDGNGVAPRITIKLCNKPQGVNITKALPTDSYPLTCSATPYGIVNTSVPLSNQAFMLTYSAQDLAGNMAVPVRRWVDIKARYRDMAPLVNSTLHAYLLGWHAIQAATTWHPVRMLANMC